MVEKLVLDEQQSGWTVTVHYKDGRKRRTTLPTRSAVAAVRCVERAVGTRLEWEEWSDTTLVNRGLTVDRLLQQAIREELASL